MIILLTYPIKSLLISGFSFYEQFSDRNPYTNCYYNGDEYTPVSRRPSNHSPLIGHHQPTQMNYLKNVLLVRHGDKIVVDSFLNDKLDLKHQNVLELN